VGDYPGGDPAVEQQRVHRCLGAGRGGGSPEPTCQRGLDVSTPVAHHADSHAHRNSDAHSYFHTDGNFYADAHPDWDPDADGNSHRHADGHGYRDSDADEHPYRHADNHGYRDSDTDEHPYRHADKRYGNTYAYLDAGAHFHAGAMCVYLRGAQR